MRLVSSTGRIALAGLLAMVISACSSTSDQEIAETFAAQRADMLGKIMPVEGPGYNIVRAKADGSMIELTLLYSGSGDIAPTVLADNLKNTYCSDNEIASLMEKGVSYKLLFRDSRGREILQRFVTYEDCVK
ncbi:type II secretion system pilot lipoprotein GspS-beta [Enterovibrio baiacu]|uniref:type II secretion system pilot lipoprotein GspS-beta n=1 Tax=Enterovibrio baiacu TaxID=2491023 RepID=UPI003D1235D8